MKRSHVIFVCLLAAAVVACAEKKPVYTEETLPKLQMREHTQELKIAQQPATVAQGQTPLAYIFVVGGPVRVVDLTSKVQVAAGVVEAQTLVRVDDKHGVVAGTQTLAAGPLPAGHEYAIFADPTTDNVSSQRLTAPAGVKVR